MQKHPDADAFMRSYLEHPADAVARLVFADWLDETGEEHNAAWAQFIRLKIEADRHAPNSTERRELDREADTHAPQIRARLAISAKKFVSDPRSLLQLLPAQNIAVRLKGFSLHPALTNIFARDILAHYRTVPISHLGRLIVIAVENAKNMQAVIAELSGLYSLDFMAVRASRSEILSLLALHFPPPTGAYTGLVHSAIY